MPVTVSPNAEAIPMTLTAVAPVAWVPIAAAPQPTSTRTAVPISSARYLLCSSDMSVVPLSPIDDSPAEFISPIDQDGASGDEERGDRLLRQIPDRQVFPAERGVGHGEGCPDREHEQRGRAADRLDEAQRSKQQRIACAEDAAKIDQLVRTADGQHRSGIGAQQRRELAPVSRDRKQNPAEQCLADEGPKGRRPEFIADRVDLEDQAGQGERKGAREHEHDETALEGAPTVRPD